MPIIGGIQVSGVLPVRDYNKKDYHEPVGFRINLFSEDAEVMESIREFIINQLKGMVEFQKEALQSTASGNGDKND